jgi:N-acyl-L-homoserine lactone synthetase
MAIAREIERTEVSDNSNSVIKIGNFTAYFAETTEQLNKAHRLRHQVFCEELNWVEPNDFGLESDEFDANAKIICVENAQGEVVGTTRVVDSDYEWMCEKYFPETISGDVIDIKQQLTAEASRIAIVSELRNSKIPNSCMTVQEVLLVMGMEFAWNYLRKRNFLVTITPLLGVVFKRRGGAIRQIGPIVTMEDGCKIASYQVDIEVSKDTYTPYAKFHQETQGYLRAC